jgi:murein DD-endopeptidase MepM/ murein hydrolase activator NlpD
MKKVLGLALPTLFCYLVFGQMFNSTAIGIERPEDDSPLVTGKAAAEQEAAATIFSTTDLVFPVKDHSSENIISFYGDARGKTRKHQGIDIKAPRHTPVLAVTDGKIEAIRESGNGGRTIYLRSTDGVLYFYAHLEDWSVAEGDTVEAGHEIATVGDSGNALGTTPHLHFEIMLGKGKSRRSIDPLPILEGV